MNLDSVIPIDVDEYDVIVERVLEHKCDDVMDIFSEFDDDSDCY
jgi:hypothetical protein